MTCKFLIFQVPDKERQFVVLASYLAGLTKSAYLRYLIRERMKVFSIASIKNKIAKKLFKEWEQKRDCNLGTTGWLTSEDIEYQFGKFMRLERRRMEKRGLSREDILDIMELVGKIWRKKALESR